MARNEREKESERILDRIARESDGGSSLFERAAKRTRDHVMAADAEGEDRIEVLGTRIGRVLGSAITVGLIAWLIYYLTSG
jgi:hypothetical protein